MKTNNLIFILKIVLLIELSGAFSHILFQENIFHNLNGFFTIILIIPLCTLIVFGIGLCLIELMFFIGAPGGEGLKNKLAGKNELNKTVRFLGTLFLALLFINAGLFSNYSFFITITLWFPVIVILGVIGAAIISTLDIEISIVRIISRLFTIGGMIGGVFKLFPTITVYTVFVLGSLFISFCLEVIKMK